MISNPLRTITIILLLASISLQGQDWAPILIGEKHHFGADGESTISQTIHIDSTQISGDVEILFLNRVLANCDTCSAESYNLNTYACSGDSCLFWSDGAQFLQRQVTIHPDGNWIFTDPENFELRPTAPLGSTWDFDAQNTAEITDISYGAILGVMDSLKVIEISDGSSLLLSQNHGLISYSDGNSNYDLVGLQTAEIGEQALTFHDIYDFEVGDVLEYRFEGYAEGYGEVYHGISQKTISNVIETDTSVTIFYSNANQYNYYTVPIGENSQSGINYSQTEDSSHFSLAKYSFLNGDLNEEVYVSMTDLGYDYYGEPYEEYNSYQLMQKSINGYRIQEYGQALDMDVINYGEAGASLLFHPDAVILISYGHYDASGVEYLSYEIDEFRIHYGFSLGKGLGMTSETWRGGIGSSYHNWLTGFSKGVDTVGVITPTSTILSAQEFTLNEIDFFPNPTHGISRVNLPFIGKFNWAIFDLQGRVIKENQGISDGGFLELDLSNRPPSIYTIQIISNEGIWQGRVLKE